MKKKQFNTAIAGLMVLLSVIACQKEISLSSSNTIPPPSNNQSLKAIAGQDISIVLPVNYCTLYGSFSSTNTNPGVITYIWKKIGGPPSSSVESPQSNTTKISNLEKGIYEFELTVANQTGLSDKDTMQITVTQDTSTALVNVYVAGDENGIPVYWKNGRVIPLNNDFSGFTATSIAASGNDIAVAQSRYGLWYEEFAAKYWKNGQETTLGTYAQATSIALRDNDVYVAGWEFDVNNRIYVAKYWKSGKEVLLSNSKIDAYATSIAVVGDNVYVAGYEGPNNNSVAKYWKNGQAISLTNGVHQAYANSIVVIGNDVYVAGSEENGSHQVAKYWKNGQEVLLSNGTNNVFATSIAVVGNDVYVVGYEGDYYTYVAKYWKNGQEVLLPKGTNPEIAWSISVHNNDAYIAMTEYNFSTGDHVAKYWKNGQIVKLSDKGEASSIIVVDH